MCRVNTIVWHCDKISVSYLQVQLFQGFEFPPMYCFWKFTVIRILDSVAIKARRKVFRSKSNSKDVSKGFNSSMRLIFQDLSRG